MREVLEMKQTENEWKKPVKVCDQSTGEEREKCLEKRKAYLKAAIRGVFFGLESCLVFRYPVLFLFAVLFLLYLLLDF